MNQTEMMQPAFLRLQEEDLTQHQSQKQFKLESEGQETMASGFVCGCQLSDSIRLHPTLHYSPEIWA